MTTIQEPVRLTSIEMLDPSPFNPRRTFNEKTLDELARSIREHGITTPLIIRPKNRRWEIVAGHRRVEAARRIGLPGVPCVERQLTDDQARDLALIDNLQREDVPPLEEANAYNELKQRLGTAEAIAQRVGKEASYVARRLALVTLAEFPKKALAERLMTIDHALLLAKLGPIEQDANLKWLLNPNAGIKVKIETVIAERIKDRDSKSRYSPWEPQSVVELKHHIEINVGRKLSRAPWDLEDADLVKEAGPCSSCPSNTKANDLLFGDMSIAAATCEDGACFEDKRLAFVRIRLTQAAGGGDDPSKLPIKLSWKATSVKPRVARGDLLNLDGFNSTQVFKVGQWREAKKGSCDFVRTGVTVDWDDPGWNEPKKLRKPGEIITVCIAEKCKVHKKAYLDPDRKGNGQRFDAKADEAKREQKKQDAIAESKIRMAAATKALDQVKLMPVAALRELLVRHCFPYEKRAAEALLPGLTKHVKEAKLDSLNFAQAIAVLSIEELTCDQWDEPKETRKDFLASLKRLGFDGSSFWLKPAEKTMPKKKGGRK